MRKFRRLFMVTLFGLFYVCAQAQSGQVMREAITIPQGDGEAIENMKSAENLPVYRQWWQIALADAAGALGGVASGNQICKHWLCSVIGGIIGAAGASVSVARTSGVAIKSEQPEVPISFRNKYEMVGNVHNAIIRDYLSQTADPDPSKLYDYIINNSQKYGLDEKPITKEMYNNIIARSSLLKTSDEAIGFLKSILPTGIGFGDKFLSAVKMLLDIGGITEFNHRSIEVEENFFKVNAVPEKEGMLYETFLSTLRHSANLWN